MVGASVTIVLLPASGTDVVPADVLIESDGIVAEVLSLSGTDFVLISPAVVIFSTMGVTEAPGLSPD